MKGIKLTIVVVLAVLILTACRTTHVSYVPEIDTQTSSELVKRLGSDPYLEDAICDKLAARHEVDFLLASLNASTNEEVRTFLVKGVLYHMDDPKVYDVFIQHLNDKENEESYFIANYLAKKGNTAALSTLNRHYFTYPVSSWQWSYTVEIFGKFKYAPSITNLIESLDAASMNVSSAACNALQEIYPDSPKHFAGPTEARNYYTERLRERRN